MRHQNGSLHRHLHGGGADDDDDVDGGDDGDDDDGVDGGGGEDDDDVDAEFAQAFAVDHHDYD